MSEPISVSPGYAFGQWSKAFRAAGDTDVDARDRAAQRVRRWEGVLQAMLDGTVAVGDRAPVAGLPSWVTLEVVRGGFTTGRALAESPLDVEERVLAKQAGVPAERAALFGHYLTDEGLAQLRTLVRSGGYRLEAPEGAALPIVAWLLENGHTAAAADLVEAIIPLAPRLRFSPTPHRHKPTDPSLVYRETAGQVRDALERRRAANRVEVMREALTVWNPFCDEVLSWWLESVGEDGYPGRLLTDAWLVRGRDLAQRYLALAGENTLCTKHRNPKENQAILLSCLTTLTAGGELGSRRLGLLRHAVQSMVRRRGAPGESRHVALREQQARDAALPTHPQIARVVAGRLAALPPDVGVTDVASVVAAIGALESSAYPAVPPGTAVPASVVRIVRRATAGRVEDLVALGLISSCETLAGLLPQLTARTFAASFPGPDLRALMASLYRAFRARRSLLLLDLQHQVRIGELPWVVALSCVRTGSAHTEARETLRELGTLALSGFPATQLPNRLVTEFASLATAAGLDLPWVEELAADIFMGVFSPKFQAAAKIAGSLLAGSVYERYYGIDFAGILALPEPGATSSRKPGGFTRVPGPFDRLCLTRAEQAGRHSGSVAANGMVIEQAQILTTHNLATLVSACDVYPAGGWQDLADGAFAHMIRLGHRLNQAARPMPVIKDLAYAWRQAIFYLSMPGTDAQAFLSAARERLHNETPGIDGMLTPVLDGLDAIVRGESFNADGRAGDGWQLLGWSTGGHWMRSRRG